MEVKKKGIARIVQREHDTTCMGWNTGKSWMKFGFIEEWLCGVWKVEGGQCFSLSVIYTYLGNG